MICRFRVRVTEPGTGGEGVTGALEVFDVIIVGAGPGGSAAALSALRARPSARVLVLDRAPLGRDKVCGDGVSPDAAEEIARLGLPELLHPSERVYRFRLVAGDADTTGTALIPGYVVPRAELDHRLMLAAGSAGAIYRQHAVREVQQDSNRVVVDGKYSAPVLIGADGANSTVRRAVGQPPNRGHHVALAVRGYAPAPAGFDGLYLRWDPLPGAGLHYAWAFATAHDTVNLGYGTTASVVTRAQLEDRAAELLPGFEVRSTRMTGHMLPLSTQTPRTAIGRVLLVGDAASLVNPLTGEGIFCALASGALAGSAAVAGNAGESYSRALRRRFGRQHRQLKALYPLLGRPSVIPTALRACGRDPRIFRQLISIGLGAGTFRVIDLARFAASMWRS